MDATTPLMSPTNPRDDLDDPFAEDAASPPASQPTNILFPQTATAEDRTTEGSTLLLQQRQPSSYGRPVGSTGKPPPGVGYAATPGLPLSCRRIGLILCGREVVLHTGAALSYPTLLVVTTVPTGVFIVGVVCGEGLWALATVVAWLSTITMLTLSVTVDPGVLPCGPVDTAPQPDTTVRIKDCDVILKWCATCRLLRPPRASHCATCNFCVENFDHHCGVTGCCVGRRTYPYFVGFLYSVACLILIVSTRCVIRVLDFDSSTAWSVSILLLLLTMGCGCQVVCGSSMYTYLSCSGMTLREYQKRGALYANVEWGERPRPFSTGNPCLDYTTTMCPPSPTPAQFHV
eukprot:PhM_4_TR12704/c0_g2_i1/m.94124/K16675/ZDHHC9_14_18; palmitoyltransferase ZDHHC9/14/18